jgi:uncharacterized protein (TIGR00266 family)
MSNEKQIQFNYTIEGDPDYSFLRVFVPPKRKLRVESASMATMSSNASINTKLRGGFSRILVGESLFINEFCSRNGDSEIGIAPGAPGEIVYRKMGGETLFLQSSSFLACSEGVVLETQWQGVFKGFFSGAGLFLIKVSGEGDLWFNSYGSVIEIENPSANFMVDNHHIVGFTEGLNYKIIKLGNYKSLFFSGEGLACQFLGTGTVWVQTHKSAALVQWLRPFQRVRKAHR